MLTIPTVGSRAPGPHLLNLRAPDRQPDSLGLNLSSATPYMHDPGVPGLAEGLAFLIQLLDLVMHSNY